jgi:hypothetical protein
MAKAFFFFLNFSLQTTNFFHQRGAGKQQNQMQRGKY